MRGNALAAGLVSGLVGLIALAPLAAHGAAAPDPHVIQVKGSDTIGGILGQEIAKVYMRQHPGVEVRWEALGSGTAFVGLLDGSAEIGAASRSVKADEIAEAKRLRIELREYVLGYDGIAVVVHPGNPVAELTVGQLSDLFTGKVANWRELGGPDLPVHCISRPSYSGTHAFFRDKVLRRGNDKGPEDFAPGTEIVEENGAILKKVAADPGAVSYVGLGWLSPEVKAIGVAPAPGQKAIRASVETVRTGTYPIYRPLLLYSAGEPRGAALSRAHAVVPYLTAEGVPRALLHVESRGSDERLATNDTASGRRRNRRVDVTLVALR